MSLLQFEEVERPTDDGTELPPSSDLVCEGCSTPLIYSGRGRKPKWCDNCKPKSSSGSSSRSTRGSSDVELAVHSLHTLYEGLVFPLTAVSPNAADQWTKEIAGLDARNRTYLSTNKDLVRKINNAAAKGGSTAFFLSHVMAVGPVAMILWTEHKVRVMQKEAAKQAEAPSEENYVNPDAMFGA